MLPALGFIRSALALSLTALLLLCTSAQPVPQLRLEGELRCNAGALKWARKAGTRTLQVTAPLPYRVVSSGDFAIVTTVGSDLAPTTWTTDGALVQRFDGMLPLLVKPPVFALGGLAADVSMANGGITLLNAAGGTAWHDPVADLLWPVSGGGGSSTFCIIASSDHDPVAPYGSAPQLARVQCPQGKELWRMKLPARGPVSDALLYGVGNKRAVLCLQYGYNEFDFIMLDLKSGRARVIRQIKGAVARQLRFPGQLTVPAGVTRSGELVSVLASDQQRGWLSLTFDLSTGRVKDGPGKGIPAFSEENSHPPGGNSIPDSAKPLFPQTLLPRAVGDKWAVPALLNIQGEVFVVTTTGAQWVAPQRN
jgi:hypothetical protein